MSQTLLEALDKLSNQIGEPLERIAQCLSPNSSGKLAVFEKSLTDPKLREELLITYTVGNLKFAKKDGLLYGLLDMEQFDLDGTKNGHHWTIWQPIATPEQIVIQPFPDFLGPWNVPDTIPTAPMRANSKAVWKFRNGSTIRATGPANLMLLPFSDKSQLFTVSVAAIITGGSGDYQGCGGVKTALGSSFLPAGVSFNDITTDTKGIAGVTVETFRVVRAKDMEAQAAPASKS